MAYLLWQLPELGGPNSSASLLSSAATAPGVMSSVKCSSSWKATRSGKHLCPGRLGLPGSIKHLVSGLCSFLVPSAVGFASANFDVFFGQCVLHSASK